MSTDTKPQYPCPACVGTMPPGSGPMSLQKMLEKGSGKVYQPYSGAVGTFGPVPEGRWYTCHRCAGTGLVDERRKGTRDRRRDTPRTSAWDELGSLDTSGSPVDFEL